MSISVNQGLKQIQGLEDREAKIAHATRICRIRSKSFSDGYQLLKESRHRPSFASQATTES